MATMEVQRPTRSGTALRANQLAAGTALTWAADTDNEYPNTGREMLRIQKGTGVATMTIASHASDPFDGTDLDDVEIAIGANSDEIYGPYSDDKHNDADGLTAIQFTDVSGLMVTVIRP